MFDFTIHIARRATAIASGAQLQSLTSLYQCSNRVRIIAITMARHAGSECNKAQDHIIFQLGTSQQFHSAGMPNFIWFTLTFNDVDLRPGTTLHHIQSWHSTVENSADVHHYLISTSTFDVYSPA